MFCGFCCLSSFIVDSVPFFASSQHPRKSISDLSQIATMKFVQADVWETRHIVQWITNVLQKEKVETFHIERILESNVSILSDKSRWQCMIINIRNKMEKNNDSLSLEYLSKEWNTHMNLDGIMTESKIFLKHFQILCKNDFLYK